MTRKRAPDDENLFPKTWELLELIHAWSGPVLQSPEFKAYNRAKLAAALDFDNRGGQARTELPDELILPEPLEHQHAAIIRFYHLFSACDRLQQCEFYFRRYPFRSGEVAKYQHLENICSMFFGGFYVVEERAASFLNALNKVVDRKLDVGRLKRGYQKMFREELRRRHDATHVRGFDDLSTNRVWMAGVLAAGTAATVAERRMQAKVYRQESQHWANLARARALDVRAVLEGLSAEVLDTATFLRSPPLV